jgi:histone-lysine N-methyltransferase SETD1
VEEATLLIRRELRQLLEKDVVDRLVSMRMRRLVADHKRNAPTVKNRAVAVTAEGKPGADVPLFGAGAGLKGLSFRKANKRMREESKPAPMPDVEAEVRAGAEIEEKTGEQTEVVTPPKKKRKKEARSVVSEIESGGEQDELELLPPAPVPASAPTVVEERKRSLVKDSEENEPPVKKTKTELADEKELVEIVDTAIPVLSEKRQPAEEVKKKSTSKVRARAIKKAEVETPIDQFVLPDDHDYDAPAVAQIHFTSDRPSSLSPVQSPVLKPKPRPPTPTQDPYGPGLCEDDEDLYFARLALAEFMGISLPDPAPTPASDPKSPPPVRVHLTGSARTEGYYKISHAEKSAYVAQYATRGAAADPSEPQAQQPKPAMTSSRSNRANARRQAQGLEEINQVQRAMALSKGEPAAAELSIKFNQLQTRKKHLRFARSPIHDWGLYAMERISRGEMVIEYVGEVIRAQVADKREKAYERQGIGSSYLFRIDEDLVVDATKKGNLGYVVCASPLPLSPAEPILQAVDQPLVRP